MHESVIAGIFMGALKHGLRFKKPRVVHFAAASRWIVGSLSA